MAAPPVPPDRRRYPAPQRAGVWVGPATQRSVPFTPKPPPLTLQQQALQQAQAYWAPVLDEYHRQQADAALRAQLAQQGLAKLIDVLQGRSAQLGSQVGDIFSSAANADYGGSPLAGGVKDMYSQEGSAYAGLPGIFSADTGNQGETQYLTAVQDANKIASDLAGLVAQTAAKIPGTAQDIYGDLYKQQQDAAHAARPVLKTIGGSLYAINPNNPTQMVLLKQAPGKPMAVNVTLSKNLGYWADAYGNPIKGITQPVPQPDAKTPKISLDLSRQMGQWVDSSGTPIPGIPGSPKKPPAAAKPVVVSATALSDARKAIAQIGKNIEIDPIATMTPPQLQAVVDKYNQSIAGKKDSKGKPLTQITVTNLQAMSPEELAILGISTRKKYTPQDAYLDAVKAGVPAKRAWQMVRAKYPNWGKGYFKPGGAEGMAPDESSGGKLASFAAQQIGKPYVWGGESQSEGGFDCSGLVDWAMRQEGYKGPRVTTFTLAKMGRSVKNQPLQPGDLIITNGGNHVVIYAGNGQVIAAHGGRSDTRGNTAPGHVVLTQPLSSIRIEDVRRINLASKPPGVRNVPPSGRDDGISPVVTGSVDSYGPPPPGLHWVRVGPNKYQLQNL